MSRYSGALTATLGRQCCRARAGGRRQEARTGDDAARDQAQSHQGNAPSLDAGLRGMLAGDGPSVVMREYVRHVDLAISSISSSPRLSIYR